MPLLLLAAPALARDGLGVFGEWAAFRDPKVPRCYAIAAAEPPARSGSATRGSAASRSSSATRGSAASRSSSATRGSAENVAYADVGTWPRRGVRGQVHLRLSRQLAAGARLSLSVGGQRFELTGGGIDAWAKDARADAAIVAAMRSAPRMSVSAVDSTGRRFTDRYSLDGVATAMDAATVGCAARR